MAIYELSCLFLYVGDIPSSLDRLAYNRKRVNRDSSKYYYGCWNDGAFIFHPATFSLSYEENSTHSGDEMAGGYRTCASITIYTKFLVLITITHYRSL